jgi:leucyl/phenylalanyl-tRNA---protein transferase
VDTAFEAVVEACAERDETWISHRIQRLYVQLHHLGLCPQHRGLAGHALVGGVYGVTLGAAFFGESMFSAV